MKTLFLFVVTALAEIIGCYLPYLWLKQGRSVWLLVPAGASLALFAWLLTLHGTATGCLRRLRGVYIGVAMVWLWTADKVRPTPWDVAGALVALTGMAIIMFQPGESRARQPLAGGGCHESPGHVCRGEFTPAAPRR